MKDYFKNLNTITQNIKRKIYKKKNSKFIIIMEKWEDIVGKEYYKKSNPIKITKDLKSAKIHIKINKMYYDENKKLKTI